MNYSTILLAAGKGSRTHLSYNKVFYKLDSGKTVLETSLDLFLNDPDCREVVIVCAEHEIDAMKQLITPDARIRFATGGETRQDSVANGLKEVRNSYVFIHDAARPYLKKESLADLKDALQHEDACLLMIPSIDTVKLVENGYVVRTPRRDDVFRAQTPQCCKTSLIRSCHEQAALDRRQATDDAQLVEWYSDVPVRVVTGDEANIKITIPADLK